MSDNPNTVTVTVTAVDQASKTLQAVGQSFNLLTGGLKDVTSKYIDYGAQVEKISLFTGVSNENTSRLIQLADDAFVSADTLQMAMKNMADKGIQPSAENMAKLSDKFLKIQDPAARSKFLIDEFGRSGMDMAKVMTLGGAKILEMNKDIEAGLVIDDAKQERIKTTRQELDKFNDSMDAMKYDMADKLLQIFNAMPDPIRNATLFLNQFLSPQNINSLVQFGILLKGANFSAMFAGIGGAVETASTALGVFAIDAWAAIAPVLAAAGPFIALGVAIALLVKLVHDNWSTFQRIAAILAFQATGKMPDWAYNISDKSGGVLDFTSPPTRDNGGPVTMGQSYMIGLNRKPEIFTAGASGNIVPLSNVGNGGVIVQLQYAPVVSLASRYEAETQLLPYIQNVLRKVNG